LITVMVFPALAFTLLGEREIEAAGETPEPIAELTPD
jgi:hypothetical protein